MDNFISIDISKKTRARSGLRFEKRDWRALLATALCATVYAVSQPSPISAAFLHLPGIGLTLSVWLMAAVCALHAGVRKLRLTRQSAFLLICTLLLSLSYAIFANDALRLMNLPVLVALCALTAVSLIRGEEVLTAAGLRASLTGALRGSLGQLFAPFHALCALPKSEKGGQKTGAALAGAMLCIPVVGIAALLLCDADADFAAVIVSLFSGLRAPDLGATLGNLLRALVLTLLLFAFVYGLTRWTPGEGGASKSRLRPLSLSMVLAALCILYAAFNFVQIQHLLRGDALLTGSCAENARSGFFQLVLVAFITLLVALPSLTLHPRSAALRALSAAATLLTAGILASAAARMAAYIRAYGWTLLRMTTLWGMLAIAAALSAILFKCVRPGTRVCKTLAIFALASWIAFNYANVDARIAQFNVSAYQRGALRELDFDYLAELSPDVLPALDALEDGEFASERDALNLSFWSARPNGYDWSLSWQKVDMRNADRLTGRWKLVSVNQQQVYPFEFRNCAEMVLCNDRSGHFLDLQGARVSDFHWSFDGGALNVADDVAYMGTLKRWTFRLEDGRLRCDRYGNALVYDRLETDAGAPEHPSVTGAVSPERQCARYQNTEKEQPRGRSVAEV